MSFNNVCRNKYRTTFEGCFCKKETSISYKIEVGNSQQCMKFIYTLKHNGTTTTIRNFFCSCNPNGISRTMKNITLKNNTLKNNTLKNNTLKNNTLKNNLNEYVVWNTLIKEGDNTFLEVDSGTFLYSDFRSLFEYIKSVMSQTIGKTNMSFDDIINGVHENHVTFPIESIKGLFKDLCPDRTAKTFIDKFSFFEDLDLSCVLATGA